MVRRYTTANQTRRIQQERESDERRTDLNRELAIQQLQLANAASEERAAEKRKIRLATQQQRELAMDEAIAAVRKCSFCCSIPVRVAII